MLPFLAFPRYFADSPLTQFYKKTLEMWISETPMAVRVLYGALFAAALLSGLLPFVMGTVTELWQLLFMYLPSLALGAFLGVRVLIAATVLHRLEHGADAWERFIPTGANAHQIVIGKWLAMMQIFRRDYVLLALVRSVVGYGLSLYFYSNSVRSCPSGLNAFCYVLYTPQEVAKYFLKGETLSSYPMPPLLFCVVALATLILFALLELGLVSAIGIRLASSVKHKLGIFRAVSVRALLAGIAIAVLLWGNQVQISSWSVRVLGGDYPAYSNPRGLLPSQVVTFVETLQIAVSPLLDGGTLIATNFLRIYTTEGFMMRHLLAVVTGLFIFALLIWLLVRGSVRLAVRRGAVPLTLNP